MATAAMAFAAKNCCPCCMNLCRKDEDGFIVCDDCDWRFMVGVTLDGSKAQMVIEQARSVYDRMKDRVVIGVRAIRDAETDDEIEDDE